MLSINGKASHLYTTLLHNGPHRKTGGNPTFAAGAKLGKYLAKAAIQHPKGKSFTMIKWQQ